ncbi:hypothetical protein FVE85_1616 [Porphyridium purpureum]|uniref:Ubiquitin-like domain-containing protein n=1 Tax=Porphyridium purpureum TaxID=35688 RepID=A0A5J4YVC9_PORPP|nr:hypothetical protein FVE85_1616 [Porphyridium purpureum]|eukprot:POR6712..scf209_3
MELEIQHKARKFSVHVDECDAGRSVLWLKQRLCETEGIPTTAENVRLFHKGKQLHDSASLRTCGMKGPRARLLLISHAAGLTDTQVSSVKSSQNEVTSSALSGASSTRAVKTGAKSVIICGSTEHTFYVEVRYKQLCFHVHPANTESPSIESVKHALASICRDRDGRGQCSPLCDELGVHLRPYHLRLLCKGREPTDKTLLRTLGICEPGTKIMMLVSNKGHSVRSFAEERTDMKAELVALDEQLTRTIRQLEHRLVDMTEAFLVLGHAKDTLASTHSKLQVWFDKFADDEAIVCSLEELQCLHENLKMRTEQLGERLKRE